MDKNRQSTGHTPAIEPEPPSAKAPMSAPIAPAMPYKKSAGDVIFDLGVYGGLGYVANAAISLVADRYGTQLPTARLYKAGQASERWFYKRYQPLMQSEQRAAEWAKLSTQIGFLGAGGWLLLAPMKWLEDRKVGMIRSLDQHLGTGPQSEEGIAVQIEALDTGPRQSIASLFFGRVFSYSATIGAALPFISDITPVGKNFTLYLNRTISPHLRESWKSPTVNIDGIMVPKLVQSMAFETILAGTASVLHYGSSKLLSHAGHHIASNQRPPNTSLPIIPPPPLIGVGLRPNTSVSEPHYEALAQEPPTKSPQSNQLAG